MDNNYLLLVEDDKNVQASNKRILERRGYKVRQAYTLAEAKAIIGEEAPSAIVLDIMLPDGNGLDFLRQFRKTSNIPVLVLTAMDTSDDVICGISAGGDNYLTKPYDLDIFVAQVAALLRRSQLIPETLSAGLLKLDTTSGMAFVNGEDMLLSKKEYSLLQLFVQHPDKTMNADYLFEKVWGHGMPLDTSALRNMVYKLRKKLEGSGYTVSSERSEGYVFELE
ncbi:MAG: response regulator transcription factor [Spirochaetaceae bacterium]|nr:response regulator transcription factor [Spirochaetaceae bacterium]